jgi:hypothetical protein
MINCVDYWNGYEVGDIRTSHPTFNNILFLRKTSCSRVISAKRSLLVNNSTQLQVGEMVTLI